MDRACTGMILSSDKSKGERRKANQDFLDGWMDRACTGMILSSDESKACPPYDSTTGLALHDFEQGAKSKRQKAKGERRKAKGESGFSGWMDGQSLHWNDSIQ